MDPAAAMPDSSISPLSSAGHRPPCDRLLPSWIVNSFSRGRPSSLTPIASSAIASSTATTVVDDAPSDGRQPHSHSSACAAAAASPSPSAPPSKRPGLRERLSVSRLYRRLSRALAPSSRSSPPIVVRLDTPQIVSDALQAPTSSSSTDGTGPDPPTGSLPLPRAVKACKMIASSADASDALVSTSTPVVDVAGAPATDPLTEMWNDAVVEWQRKMGVDLTSPEAILLSSKEAIVRYIARMEEESQSNLKKSRWRRLGDTLIPLARTFKKLCGPIGDTLSSTVSHQLMRGCTLLTHLMKGLSAQQCHLCGSGIDRQRTWIGSLISVSSWLMDLPHE